MPFGFALLCLSVGLFSVDCIFKPSNFIYLTKFTVNKKYKCISSGIFHLKVPESSPVGSAIGRIKAVDPDFGQNAEIEYNIVPGDGGNLFDIVTDEDTQEGVIKLKKVRGHIFE